jgi:hypothetical protein
VDNDGVAALERLRERTLDALGRHYAAGHVRDRTLEHRVQTALMAQTSADLADVMWDLPPLDVSAWKKLLAQLAGLPERRPCTRMAFKVAPEVVLDLEARPRTWLIGRSGTCDVVLHAPAVSRRHALVSVRGGRCSIRDLGSSNGIRVNGHTVNVAQLAVGDVVTLGSVVHAVVA